MVNPSAGGTETHGDPQSRLPDPVDTALRVRYGECDPQGIVFNANYLLYADVAFTEFWRATVGPWQEMVLAGFDAVVAEANLRFRSSAIFDDELVLRTTARGLGETSLRSDVAVRRGPETLVEIELRHVCIDVSSRAKAPWPGWIRERLSPPVGRS